MTNNKVRAPFFTGSEEPTIEQKLIEIKQDNRNIKAVEAEKDVEVEKVMKTYNLRKEQKGIRFLVDKDLHDDFKILCIKKGKTQDECLVNMFKDYMEKEEKRFK